MTQVKALPKPLNRIQGLSLNQGRLVVAQDEYGATRTTLLRTVAATGTPTFGDSSRFLDTRNSIDHCPDDDAGCGAIHGMGDGEIAWLNRNAEAGYDRLWVAAQGSAVSASFKVPEGGRIADVSSRYLLYTTPDGQYVHRFRNASQQSGDRRCAGDLGTSGGKAREQHLHQARSASSAGGPPPRACGPGLSAQLSCHLAHDIGRRSRSRGAIDPREERTMPEPTTLRDLAGLPATPPPLADSALVMIDCQNTYTRGVMELDGVAAALDQASELLQRAAPPESRSSTSSTTTVRAASTTSARRSARSPSRWRRRAMSR